jgi:hypothetical protein
MDWVLRTKRVALIREGRSGFPWTENELAEGLT